MIICKIRNNIIIFHILFIILAAIIVYSNSLQVPFQLDDDMNIARNPLIQDSELMLNPLPYCSKLSPMTEEENVCKLFRTRYFGYLTFALNYRLDGTNVIGYHILNIIIHIICSLLVYLFVILTFKTPYLIRSELEEFKSVIALFSGLIFAVHPVQTQAVTYIVQRFASLATMLYLSAFVFYIKWRLLRNERIQKSHEEENADVVRKAKEILLYLASIIAAVLAMKTKEIAFTLPFLLVIYDVIFFREKVKTRFIYIVPYLLTLLIIPMSIIGFSGHAGHLADSMNKATNLFSNLSRLEYLFTEFRVIVTYLRLLILPVNQNLDYDYQEYHTFFDPAVLSSFLLLSLMVGAGLFLIIRFRNRFPHTRLIAFGVFWFFITLSVESSVIPIVDVIFEHRLYLPSAGFIIAVITTIFWMVSSYKSRWNNIEYVAVTTLTTITLVFSLAAFSRNLVWQDYISLWEDVVKKSPQKARAYYTLGDAYQQKKQTQKAMESYGRAIQLDPTYFEAYNNLGNLYWKAGQYELAEKYLSQAIFINSSSDRIYDNRARLYFVLGQYGKATRDFTSALAINPNQAKYYKNRGRAYAQLKEYQRAIEDFTAAIRILSFDSELFALRGLAYSLINDKIDADSDFRKACSMGNRNACHMIYAR
jgi:tetratricopeptide (TPR) repeat protein